MSNAEPKSPLTIIAIFAGIIEASALASLPFLGEDSQSIYTWFLVGFPPFLTLLFFLTLNFNTKSLYGPDPNEVDDPELTDDSEGCTKTAPATAPSSHWQVINIDVPPGIQRAGENLEYPVSTIILRGTQARSLIRCLIKRAVSRHAKPGSLILQDLDAGQQTTIITGPISASTDHHQVSQA
ncbi:hypothetical protein [Pseudomonas sp. SDI]|uniref:hypothetical protein n=1 Tax=Pseudomonas sp. SDI TaxID=2170734 RepID=UPI0021147FCC|nr:hypothetical protein [Pseudomonas sp. SDI]